MASPLSSTRMLAGLDEEALAVVAAEFGPPRGEGVVDVVPGWVTAADFSDAMAVRNSVSIVSCLVRIQYLDFKSGILAEKRLTKPMSSYRCFGSEWQLSLVPVRVMTGLNGNELD